MKKEDILEKNTQGDSHETSRLTTIAAGAILGAAAFLVSGCDYILSYSTYDPFYPRTYYEYRTIEPFSHYYYSYPSYRSP